MSFLRVPRPIPEVVDSRTDDTGFGRWNQFVYADGTHFVEFLSHQSFWGFPLVHITRGQSPETGKFVTARGILAIGRRSTGVIAVGQFACGIIAVGQFALGVLFGLGQFFAGAFGIGQFAVCGMFGIGQFATGYVAIGQFAFGQYALGQFAIGAHVWDTRGADPLAQQFFGQFLQFLQQLV